MKARHFFLGMLATAIAVSLANAAHAAVIFSEDFDDITVTGNNLTTGTAGNSFNTTTTTSATSTAIVRADSGNLFGAGTSNQYLELNDTSAASGITLRKQSIAGIATNGVAQLSFDFYDPVGGLDPLTDDTVVFTLDTGSGATTSASIRLFNNSGISSVVFFNAAVDPVNYVTVAPYSEGAKHHLDLALNYGASAVAFPTGSGSLAAQSYHVWLDGASAGTDYPFFNSVTSNNRLTISSSGGATAAQNVDTVVLDSAITIPEPGGLVLSGIGIAVLALGRKRCRGVLLADGS